MKARRRFNIMLGLKANDSSRLKKQMNGIHFDHGSMMELEVSVCQSITECHRQLSEKAHLMLMDFSDSLIENEADTKKVKDFCKKHRIINVRSETELLLAIGMMNKGIWDYIRP